jgi:hypothetical protein
MILLPGENDSGIIGGKEKKVGRSQLNNISKKTETPQIKHDFNLNFKNVSKGNNAGGASIDKLKLNDMKYAQP